MPTTPEQVRTGLVLVTTAAANEMRAVVEQAPQDAVRGVIFEAAPAVVGAYVDGTAALALDWYEELREDARVTAPFVPTVVANVREDYLQDATAWATEALSDFERQLEQALPSFEQAIDDTLAKLLPVLEKEIAAGLWDTMTENVVNDPDARGWRRHSRPGACPFCRMLADKGAVYSRDTVRFAAHKNCLCTVSPAFKGDPGEDASVIQYAASQKRRSAADKARLRQYLKDNYGA